MEKIKRFNCKVCNKPLDIDEAEFEMNAVYCKEHFNALKDNWAKRQIDIKDTALNSKEQRTLS